MPTNPKATMFKMSLRDLFWLVLVCALAVGWWAHQRTTTSELQNLRQELTDSQGDVRNLRMEQVAILVELEKERGPGTYVFVAIPEYPGFKFSYRPSGEPKP